MFTKTCFVISPIGPEGTQTRKRSDQVLKYIIQPIAEKCGYNVIRADQIPQPGMITPQVIDHILDDDLVIADLSEKNANVFYELALRHATKKALVQIIHYTEKMPFDVADMRTIHFNYQDMESVEKAKEDLGKQIKAVEVSPDTSDNPITRAVTFRALTQSSNPSDQQNAMLQMEFQKMRSELASLQFSIARIGDVNRPNNTFSWGGTYQNPSTNLSTPAWLGGTDTVSPGFSVGLTENNNYLGPDFDWKGHILGDEDEDKPKKNSPKR